VISNQDAEHLRLLSIFHYIAAGIVAVGSLLSLLHMAVGLAVVTGAFDEFGQGAPQPPAVFGWMIVGFAAFFIVFGLATAAVVAIVGQRLQQKRSHTFCLVVAGIECLFTPIGTVLGVFTIVILMRPSVKELFEGVPAVQPQSPDSWSE